MTPVQRYEDLSPLLSAQLRRGVLTNCFLGREALEGLIQNGALLVQTLPRGLLLAVERPGFFRLHFYLTELSSPLALELPGPVVCEIPFRPRDTGLREAVHYLEGQGFFQKLSRVRLSRPGGEVPEVDFPLDVPQEGDRPELLAFLRAHFDPLTGCLPTQEELSKCLCRRADGALSGLIHFTNTRRGGEIRHLALRPQDRGRGLSRALIAGCLRALEGGACTVWTGADNRPALGAYQSMGFQADGWRSAVLIRP